MSSDTSGAVGNSRSRSRSRVVRLMLANHEPVDVIRRKGVVKFNPSFFEMVRARLAAAQAGSCRRAGACGLGWGP